MATELIQANKLSHKSEVVITPEVKNMSQKQWAEKFNAESPEHITYTVKGK